MVAGLQADRYNSLDQPENATFGFFDITPYGISYACFGFIYIVIAARWLLPGGSSSSTPQGILMAMRITTSSKLHQKTVVEGGLKGLRNLFLVSVGRNGHVTHAVGPDFMLEHGDCLYFSGALTAAEALAEKLDLELVTADEEASLHGGKAETPGLARVDNDDPEQGAALPDSTKLIEVTVNKNSDLIGKQVRESRIARRFAARVLAIKRGKQAVSPPLSDVVLQAGDVLVLSADEGLDMTAKEFKAEFKNARNVSAEQEKEYVTGMRVLKRSKVADKTLGEAGLTGVNGLTVVAINREDGESVRVVNEDTVIQAGDTLWFSGSLDGVSFLLRMPGLANMHGKQISKLGINILERRLVQASIAMDSPLTGQTVREAAFRARFDAVVISISRQGMQITQDVRDVRLQAGDVLLLDTGSRFLHRYKSDQAFNLLSEVPNTSPLKASRMWWALFLGIALITTQVVSGAADIETLDLFPGAVLVGGIMVATRCMTGEQARKSINWDVYVCIAFAFAVSTSLEKTTVAQALANLFKSISEAVGGDVAPLIAMYIATGLLSEIITNNAAAALMYPIAAQLGDMLGIEPRLMSVSIMLGASASFITPIGYQCNLMVFAAGGYRTWEFIRFGVPMQMMQIVAAFVIFIFKDQPWVVAGLSTAATAAFVGVCALWTFVLPTSLKNKLVPGFMRGKHQAHERVL